MKSIRKRIVLASVIAVMLSGAALALDIGDLIKVFGIGYAVKTFSKPIDKEINRLLKEREAQVQGATKVVPILSLGAGGFIGAAQVVGVPEKVKAVQAVLQIEVGLGTGRAKALIPISTKKPVQEAEKLRVPGVGVSAVIDIKI
jgi:hypothetical protein